MFDSFSTDFWSNFDTQAQLLRPPRLGRLAQRRNQAASPARMVIASTPALLRLHRKQQRNRNRAALLTPPRSATYTILYQNDGFLYYKWWILYSKWWIFRKADTVAEGAQGAQGDPAPKKRKEPKYRGADTESIAKRKPNADGERLSSSVAPFWSALLRLYSCWARLCSVLLNCPFNCQEDWEPKGIPRARPACRCDYRVLQYKCPIFPELSIENAERTAVFRLVLALAWADLSQPGFVGGAGAAEEA